MDKKLIIFLVIAFIIIAAGFVCTSDGFRIFYYKQSQTETFNVGDKLYLKKEFLNTSTNVPTYRAVRPLTMDEYEISNYWNTKEEADKKYKQIFFANDLLLINSFQDIDQKKLKQTGSSYIGTYKGLCLLNVQNSSIEITNKQFFYEVDFKKDILNNRDSLVDFPTNYFWEDDKLYIPVKFVTKK